MMTPETRRAAERIEMLLDLTSCSPELKRELRRSIEAYGNSRNHDALDKVLSSIDDLVMKVGEDDVPF